jgi:hypothetical protein
MFVSHFRASVRVYAIAAIERWIMIHGAQWRKWTTSHSGGSPPATARATSRSETFGLAIANVPEAPARAESTNRYQTGVGYQDIELIYRTLGFGLATAIDVGNPALMRARHASVFRAGGISRDGGWTGAFSRQCSQIPVSLTENSRFSYKGKRWINVPEKRHDFNYAATRKGRERGKFPILFPVNGNLPARRPVRQDCVHHHPVPANRPGFQGDKNPRNSGRLASRSAGL